MNTPTTLTVGDVVHEYARDRAPYDDPIGLAQWRYRWACSCGGSGNWHLGTAWQVYQGWRKHIDNARARARAAS